MHRILLAIAAIGVGSMLCSCATSPDAGDGSTAPRYAAALAHPERLEAIADRNGAVRWKDEACDFRKYDKVLIEQIRVQPAADSPSINPNDLKILADYFHDALVRSFAPPYAIVKDAGPGVLRMRITLVDLVATHPEISVIVLAAPFGTAADLAANAASGRPAGSEPYLGKTTIAVQFIDGETSAVVAEYAETRFGRKYVLRADGGRSAGEEAAKNYVNAFSSWAYARQAFDGWSQEFRAWVGQVDGRH